MSALAPPYVTEMAGMIYYATGTEINRKYLRNPL